jgi:mono/diheme cytochrome c family protein
MRGLVIGGTVIVMVVAASLTYSRADDKAKPEYDVKQVMKLAHKDKLLQKVTGGNAGEEEKKQLLALYQALAANEPPVGDAASWKEKNDAIVKAAQAVVDGGTDYDALKKATSCAGCHKAHKPK